MIASAAIFRGVGLPFDQVNWPLPRPRGTEVLVEVIACTLCGSDLHSIHGRRSVPVPTILGHEILGRVVDFGPDASRVDAAGRPLGVGDRVTWAIVASCGDCFYCRRDLSQKCEHGFKYGHEPLRPGRELSGGLADHCLLVPGTSIFRVPADLSDAVACPSSCATATVAAALEAAGPIAGRSVLILGAGMLGVTAAAWSRSLGACDVIVCDPNDDRLSSAAAFGVTKTSSPTRLAGIVAEATGGRGMDIALELSARRRRSRGPCLCSGWAVRWYWSARFSRLGRCLLYLSRSSAAASRCEASTTTHPATYTRPSCSWRRIRSIRLAPSLRPGDHSTKSMPSSLRLVRLGFYESEFGLNAARMCSRAAAADRLLKNLDEESFRWRTFLLGPFTKPVVQPGSDSHLEGLNVGGLVLPIGDHPARGGRTTLFGLVAISL